MGAINSPAEGRVAYRSAPCTHGYPVYAGHGKRPVLSRVPTHFRPESPRSRRKTLCFQYGGCPGRARICLLTANSGQIAQELDLAEADVQAMTEQLRHGL